MKLRIGLWVRRLRQFSFRLDSEQRHLDEQAMRQNVPKITLDKNIQVSETVEMFLNANFLH